MADKKKQHYVPKFYLKLFSILPKKKHIKIFNKSSDTIISQGPLKNQAYGNYFYGKNLSIENSFAILEQDAANVIKEIIQSKKLPSINNEAYETLQFFTLLQAYRTKFMADSLNEMINSLYHAIAQYDSKLKKLMEGIIVKFEEPALFNLEIIGQIIHVAYDLEIKLIINNSGTPFITSDNPVMRYNQFLERKKHPAGKTGLALKGLQIFYPLSPKLMLVLFDDKVYKVGNRKQKVISTSIKNDIDSLNLLQFINSDKVVFSNDSASDLYLNKISKRHKIYSKSPRISIKEYYHKKSKSGLNTVTLHQSNKDIETGLNLSFIKETTHAKKYKMSGYIAELRKDDRT